MMLRAIARYLPIAIFFGVWQLAVMLDLVDRAFLPPVDATIAALWEMTKNGEIGVNLAVSIYRALTGLAIGSVLGVAIGVAMATSRQADRFLARWSQPPIRCRNPRWCRCSSCGSGSATSRISSPSSSPACSP
jgi:ABC-type nitrate/sulfonate/bicarbonate transport system permease component